MEPSFRLGRIAGIDVGVHWTVVFIVAVVAWSLSAGVLPDTAPGYSTWEYWLAGIIAACAFGASILAHELSHSVVARRENVGVDSIVLWLFGGMAKLRSHASTAGSELRIAIAGPAMSVAVGVIALALAVVVDAVGVTDLVVATLAWFGATNLLIAVFNLLPGAPLDGGRVLAAVLWMRTGDPQRARARASAAGRVLGQILIGVGIVEFAYLGAAGLWTALVGWLILSMARMELVQNEFETVFAGVRVRDVMTSDVVSVPDGVTIEEFVRGPWVGAHVSTFPLVDELGRPTGLVSVKAVAHLDRSSWPSTPLIRVATPIADLVQAQPDDPLIDALQRRNDERARVLVTMDERLVGIVSPTDVTRAFDRLSLIRGQRAPTTATSSSGGGMFRQPTRRHVTLPPPPPKPR